MKVYRIESIVDPARGFYRLSRAWAMLPETGACRPHPDDGEERYAEGASKWRGIVRNGKTLNGYRSEAFFFGFSNIDQLNQWFPYDAREKLNSSAQAALEAARTRISLRDEDPNQDTSAFLARRLEDIPVIRGYKVPKKYTLNFNYQSVFVLDRAIEFETIDMLTMEPMTDATQHEGEIEVMLEQLARLSRGL